jgi:hypothetical protein
MVKVTSRIERVLPLPTGRSSYVLGFSGPRPIVGIKVLKPHAVAAQFKNTRPHDLFVLQMP